MTAADTAPIDISWEEVGPAEPQERPADPSPWEDVDRRVRERIAEALTMAENRFAETALGRMDALSAIPAFTRTAAALASQPNIALKVGTNYANGIMRAFLAAGQRAAGSKADGPVAEPKDKRFADPSWSDNAGFWLLRQQFLLAGAGRPGSGRAGADRRGHPHQGRLPEPGNGRRRLADQHVPDQPGRHAPGGRNGRPVRHPRHQELPARPGEQRRAAAAVRHRRVRGRQEHGRHPRQGRFPERV